MVPQGLTDFIIRSRELLWRYFFSVFLLYPGENKSIWVNIGQRDLCLNKQTNKKPGEFELFRGTRDSSEWRMVNTPLDRSWIGVGDPG